MTADPRGSVGAPSKRFIRAAQAERTALLRAHARLAAERDRLASLLDHTSSDIDAIEDRLRSLAQLVGDPELARIPPSDSAAGGRSAQIPHGVDANVISGPEIRHTAVRVLLDQPQPFNPVHYSDWYALLTEAGHVVAGKDPKAVFLTQISRSPVVAKSAEPGEYSLDPHAPGRLRATLERLQAELCEIAALPPDTTDALDRAGRRRRLILEVNRVERDLAEASHLLPEGLNAGLLHAA